MPPYKCPFCSFTNINKSNLKTHLNKKKLCYNKNELSNFIINNHKLINKLQKNNNKLEQKIKELNNENKELIKNSKTTNNINNITNNNIIIPITNNFINNNVSKPIKKGIVYLIQPAELIGTYRYKVGFSENTRFKRLLKDYKVGTRFLCILEINNPDMVEKQILNEFNNYYKLLCGNEYFICNNENDIINRFYNIVYPIDLTKYMANSVGVQKSNKTFFIRSNSV
tara:strand:+ start:5552 stop:6229 length:678 start_codon:yes stop_codon:yes gene_type:complete